MKNLLFILPVIILFSCSVQKRKYQKGFYVSSFSKVKSKSQEDKTGIKKEVKSENLVVRTITLPIDDNSTTGASVNKTSSLLKPVALPSVFYLNDTCDVITLKNGEEVNANVLEITPIEVKYKKCGVTDGPLYIVKKSDIFMIKYKNGTKEVFKSEPVNTYSNTNSNTAVKTYNGPKKTHPLAIVAFILSILGIWPLSGLGALLAVIFASIALKKIRQHPDVYKGESLAIAAQIIGIVVLSLILLVIIIAIALIL